MASSPEQELHQLERENLLRSLRTLQSGVLPHVSTPQGQTYLNFSSNDYLGLSQHPTLKRAAIEATEKHGTGATASRLVCGTFDFHRQLEQRLATHKQSEDARLFANGYATALGTITALVGKEDIVILDKLSHACLIDAVKLSGATLRVFPHNNLERLETILKSTREKSPDARILVVTESVFSMDGDCCPLKEIVSLKEKYGALLLLDEAHAFGILGEKGLGLAEALGLQAHIELQMGTLGKAAGSAGGYIAASQSLIDLITNRARSFIYSTAPPPAQVAASLAAIEIITSSEGTQLRERLLQNIQSLATSTSEPLTPILPIIFGANEKAMQASETLRDKGFLVPAIRFPTVPKNTARLRVTLSAAHSQEQVHKLKSALAEISPESNLSSIDVRL